MFSFSEETYKTNLTINYVLEKGVINTDYLVIIFSGFNSPKAEIQHSYNYMRTLRNIDCNKLFILDNYGPRGCYYLGQNMSFEVETSVLSLITYITRKLNIDWKNIISAGSSKGGSAALYFGLKYNFGHIISGAPQTLLADYINKTTEETANFMLGEVNHSGNSTHLNEIIFKQLEEKIDTKIHILSSENDWQYNYHVKPFLIEMNKYNVKYNLKIENNIKGHNDIATYFPNFLLTLLFAIIFDFSIKDFTFTVIDNCQINARLTIDKNLPNNIHIKYIVKKQGKIKDTFLLNQLVFSYTVKEPDIYELSVEFSKGNLKFYELFLGKEIVGLDYFKFNSTEIKLINNKIHFSLLLHEYQKLDYAYYIIKDGKVLKKIWYNEKKEITYEPIESGQYQIMFFIRNRDGDKIIDKSNIIEIK